jgi:hypothetical protein
VLRHSRNKVGIPAILTTLLEYTYEGFVEIGRNRGGGGGCVMGGFGGRST